MAEIEAITGRYVQLDLDEGPARVFFEQAGRGIPLICLHTAGSDARQWRHLLADSSLTDRFAITAFDLPWHGRSLPPGEWWSCEYRLGVATYAETALALATALELERPLIIGCSVGGVTALELAWHHAEEIGGAIAIEAAAKIEGRFRDESIRPDVNAQEYVASWTFGLMAPDGPEAARREVWWEYAQGGPGVYRGDTWAWSEDFDLRGHESEIDTARCPLWILCGEYDYVCTPKAAAATADAIPGAAFRELPGLGHFPMSENYPVFREHLVAALEDLASKRTGGVTS